MSTRGGSMMLERIRLSTGGLLTALVAMGGAASVAQAAPSDLDTTFGTGGIVPGIGTTTSDGDFWSQETAIASDGTIITTGTDLSVPNEGDSHTDFLTIARTASGAHAWTAQTNFSSAPSDFPPPSTIFSEDIANSIAIRPDGRVVAVGSSLFMGNSDALAQYTTTGAPDPAFGGGDGLALGASPAPQSGESDVRGRIALQPDGGILLVKNVAFGPALIVRRYSATGALDGTFGSGGTLQVPVAEGPGDYDIAAQADGKFLVIRSGFTQSAAVLRYEADGDPDATFGVGGAAVLPDSLNLEVMTIQADGKVLVAGENSVARVTASGVPDPTFGGDGVVGGVTLDLTGPRIEGLAVQSDGKILVAGGVENAGGFRNGVARLNADGTPDRTFAPGGDQTIDINPDGDYNAYVGAQVGLQADGKIVLSGLEYSLARLVGGTGPDLGPDPTTPVDPPADPPATPAPPVTTPSQTTAPSKPKKKKKKKKKRKKK